MKGGHHDTDLIMKETGGSCNKSCTFKLTDGFLALVDLEHLEGLTLNLWLDHHDFESYQAHWFTLSSRWMFVPLKPNHQKRVCFRMHNNMIRELICWCYRCCCPSIVYTCSSPTGARRCCCHHIVTAAPLRPLVLTDAAADIALHLHLYHCCLCSPLHRCTLSFSPSPTQAHTVFGGRKIWKIVFWR